MTSKITRRDVLIGAATIAAAPVVHGQESVAASPKTHGVIIKSFKFEPQKVIVEVGDTIRWTNEDLAPHTATAIDSSWDTAEIVRADTRSIKVTEGLETEYYCAFHPHMKGTIELM